VSDKGLFLSLDRLHHGRVKKNQLSDGFIEDPAAAFPIGTLLTARVLSVQQAAKPQEGDAGASAAAAAAAAAGRWSGRVLGDDGARVELTLLSGELSGLRQIEEFKEGELTRGKVRGAVCVGGGSEVGAVCGGRGKGGAVCVWGGGGGRILQQRGIALECWRQHQSPWG
jgi:hypothetical protein